MNEHYCATECSVAEATKNHIKYYDKLCHFEERTKSADKRTSNAVALVNENM